jgi:hypothetical protein
MKTDTILQHPKHILQKNGLLQFEPITETECFCSHPPSEQLDGVEVCLEKDCICENFQIEKKEVEISPARKNLPEKYVSHFNKPMQSVGPPSSLFV